MSWEFSPVLISSMVLAATVYARGVLLLWDRAGAGRGVTYGQAACFAAGLGVLVVALASPLHAASEDLFSMHMLQHLLLIAVAAPLLAWSNPGLALAWAVPSWGRRPFLLWARRAGTSLSGRWVGHPGLVLALYVVMVWFWHQPQPYQAAVNNETWHYLEHSLLLAAAGAYWWRVAVWAGGTVQRQCLAIIYLFVGMLAGSALGGFLLLAGDPLYLPHSETPAGQWLNPLADQQLGGLMMLMPAGMVHVGLMLALILRILNGGERQEASAARAAHREAWDGAGR